MSYGRNLDTESPKEFKGGPVFTEPPVLEAGCGLRQGSTKDNKIRR